jgi:hypothetical protein
VPRPQVSQLLKDWGLLVGKVVVSPSLLLSVRLDCCLRMTGEVQVRRGALGRVLAPREPLVVTVVVAALSRALLRLLICVLISILGLLFHRVSQVQRCVATAANDVSNVLLLVGSQQSLHRTLHRIWNVSLLSTVILPVVHNLNLNG